MELLKPIHIKKWISESKFDKYVFDTNNDNKYDSSYIVIREYIFQDNNIEDALNKIAYFIQQHDKTNSIKTPFYCWESNDDKPILFEIETIMWKGYHVNPFKSKDRTSEQLKEPIKIIDNNELFKRVDLNIVFYNDFNFNIKYYFDKKISSVDFDKKMKELIKKEEPLVKLYRENTVNAKILSEDYYDISFQDIIPNIDKTLVLFDKLQTNTQMQLIQLVNDNNKAIYKIYKKHTFFNERELSNIFNLNNIKEYGCLNIYYYGKNAKMSIFDDGRIIINFKYPVDNGKKWDKIINDRNDFVKYLKESLNIDANFQEIDINNRINYTIDNTEYATLIKKIGTYTNIFEAIVFKSDKKNIGYYAYKRTPEFINSKFDITAYIKSRIIVGMNEEEIVKELINFGYTKKECAPIVKTELDIIGEIGYNNLDKNVKVIDGTYIVVKKSGGGFEIDIKSSQSFFELTNLKYWLIRIIEKTRDIVKKQVPKKLKAPSPEPAPVPEPDKSSSSDENLLQDDDVFDDFSNFKGGTTGGTAGGTTGFKSGGTTGGVRNAKNENYKNYLIDRLKNADKELYKDNNKSRKCQKKHQPVVLSKDELNELKAKGHDKMFDNIIEHGSSPENKNYYTCPRLWCPISKIPLDDTVANPTCPGDNEEPMNMNEDMKNANKPRYVYLIKNINIPCCGKKKPNDTEDIFSENGSKASKNSNASNASKGSKNSKDSKGSKDSSPKGIAPIINIPVINKAKKGVKKSINDDDRNYIMNKVPIPYKGRYGDIIKELYQILYPDNYLTYSKQCSSPNNINKTNCVLRKGLIDIKELNVRYDNIIHTIAYLLGKTKRELIDDIINGLDIMTYISLDNGNVCKDFVDIEPVIYEENVELYEEFLEHIKKFSNILLDIPAKNDNSKESLYKKSRLLYIYKSYKKFIKYLEADDYPYDKGIQYIYSLVAIIYKRLIVLWEIEKTENNTQVNIICPFYTRFVDIEPNLDRNPKVIMIVKENNFYEPLISRAINMKADNKTFNLDDFPLIKEILTECSEKHKFSNNAIGIFNNRENIRVLNKLIKESSELFVFETIIINSDFSIDKIMLKNNMILRFKPQSIVLLHMLVKEFDIKSIVFHEDIIGKEYTIKILKSGYKKYNDKIKKIKDMGFFLEIGENIIDNDILMMNKLIITDDNIRKNSDHFLLFDSNNKYHKYVSKDNRQINEWIALRKIVKNKLLSSKYNNEYYSELSKKSRKIIIKTLLEDFKPSNTSSENSSRLRKIQIILEEIPVTSINSIKKWYNDSLLYVKYDYINELSDYIKDTGNELVFTQFSVSNKIARKILNYHEALPNNINSIEMDVRVDQYNIEGNEHNESKGHNQAKSTKLPDILQDDVKYEPNVLPDIFKGVETILNSKWTKYKKKIWYKLRYVKNTYTKDTIENLFEYLLKKLNINIVTYRDIIYKNNRYYNEVFNKDIKDNLDKNKAKRIRVLFKDPHFYSVYVNTMNILNGTKKSFKTLKIFNDTYFDKSTFRERMDIIKHIRENKSLIFPSDIALFNISKMLNITILIIHNRAEYGKGVSVDVRAGDKDLNITTSTYKAETDILTRPLIMLYRKIEKTNISYYIIKNIENNDFYYNELKDCPDEIKNKIVSLDTSNYISSVSTSPI
jgi:hypothetical protein